MPNALKVELRAEVDKDIIDVIDAVVAARKGTNRTEVITEILDEWAQAKIHESMIVLRVSGRNPT